MKYLRFSLAGCLGALLVSQPVHAGFFFEGLQPFSVRACHDQAPFSDPVVTSGGQPPVAVEGTPSAFNDAGVPRFLLHPCAPQRTGGKTYAPSRRHTVTPQK